MIAGFAGYGLGLMALNSFYTEHSPYRYWLILLPILPILYLVAVIIRYVSELDEMWRKIITEAAAFSGIATGFSAISYMFLRDMGAPELRGQWVFCMMWAYYGIGLIFSWRRYR
jgi:hypothetical protein